MILTSTSASPPSPGRHPALGDVDPRPQGLPRLFLQQLRARRFPPDVSRRLDRKRQIRAERLDGSLITYILLPGGSMFMDKIPMIAGGPIPVAETWQPALRQKRPRLRHQRRAHRARPGTHDLQKDHRRGRRNSPPAPQRSDRAPPIPQAGSAREVQSASPPSRMSLGGFLTFSSSALYGRLAERDDRRRPRLRCPR